jgi:3D (Asp-Asp-Asp) domain-containing protein
MDLRTIARTRMGGGFLRRTTTAGMVLVMGGAVAWACAPGGGGVAAAALQQPSLGLAPPASAAILPVPEQALTAMPDLAAELEESARAASTPPPAPVPEFPVAATIEMNSTAYCLRGNMRTGVRTRDGMAAGDPSVLPLGSVVRVSHPDGRPVGIFVIMDTGGAIRGNKIDIYMESCAEARRWGRRPVVAEVLNIGRV